MTAELIERPLDGEDYGCCALDEGHDGPCAWICNTCMGSGWCPECGGDSRHDDVTYCDSCSGYGMCPAGCDEGLVGDEF